MNQLITAFNSGEVSPLLAGRVDLPNIARSCRILRGWIPGITGGAFRRPPLLNVGAVVTVGGARLIPFNISAGISFQIEAERHLLRMWNGGGSGLDASVVAPWNQTQIDAIQYVQSNDVMWLASPSFAPQELQHQGAGVWTLNEIPWKYPPLRDENLTAITITPSALSGAITLTASAAYFTVGMVGGFFEISHFRAAVSSEIVVPIIPPAAALLPFTVIPVADTTLSIGGTTYTWKAAVDVSGPGHVAIGADAKTSRDNAINAILATGTGFGIGTAPNPDVTAETGGDSTTSNSATGTLTTDGTNAFTTGTNSKFTIGTITYRAEAGAMHISGTTYDFRKGATDQDTLKNLADAINLTGIPGVSYVVGMIINPDVTAALRTSAIGLTAKTAGAAGNAVVTTASSTGGHQSFGAATLTGGNAAPTYKLKVNAKTLGDPGNNIKVSDTAATDHWNTPTLTGGKYYGTTAIPVTSTPISVKGQWDFTTYGRWIGTVFIDQQNAAGTWDILRQITGRMDTNRTLSGIADPTQIMRIRVVNMAGLASSDAANPRFVLEATQSIVHGLVKITGFTSSTLVSANVINDLYSTDATPNWREGAFSDYRGFPSCVCLHEQRLIFAGNASEPQKLWASVVGDFRNFEETGFDDGSWQYALATSEANAIVWVASQQGLIIGTTGDEWLMDGGATGITPTSAQAKRQSAYGSDSVQALIAGSLVIFIERGGLKAREYVFDYQQVGFVAPDITEIVSHLTRGGIKVIVHQRAPWSVLWMVTYDGQLLAATYSRENQVIAFSPIPVDGPVQSVSVTYGARGEADEVWIIVDRSTLTGTWSIERLDPRHWIRLMAGDFCYHLDLATTGTIVSPGVFGGFSYLNGLTATVIADGTQQPDQVVVGGHLTVPEGTSEVIAGRPQPDSVLQPAIFDVPTQKGTSMGNKMLTTEAAYRFYMTMQAGYSRAPGADPPAYVMNFRQSTDPEEAPPPPFTGLKLINVPGNFDDACELTLYAYGIGACNVLAMTVRLNVTGP